MARHRYLRNAPVTEAVIDLRVRQSIPSNELDIECLSYLPTQLKEQYSRIQPVRVRATMFGFGLRDGQPKVEQPQHLEIYAYRFESEDGKQIAIFKRDGFGFNRLRPYTKWSEVSAEARKLWEVYLERVKPEYVTRVAVRYINHLEIPLPVSDFKDYLTAPPHIPKTAPQSVSSFLTRVVVHDQQRQLYANITQAMERSTKPDYIVIIVDIDAYKIGEFEPKTDEIWAILNQLRDLKNTIFFGSIKERTARLFQ